MGRWASPSPWDWLRGVRFSPSLFSAIPAIPAIPAALTASCSGLLGIPKTGGEAMFAYWPIAAAYIGKKSIRFRGDILSE
ncbi:hypothetical protein GCM10025772_26670 [Ferrimonas gelatinilytica]|uniref:Uncharacterized protein n=1 Tax=Ferrimonas gelatinilytica TaxID=1255257 RepID=A0ABP9SCI9_9GAMM